MERFQKRFIDEALEYFENLESVLLDIESDYNNKQAIDEVFRVMHSLKGSGAMFGFDLLSEVTHDLESLFELIRNGEMQLNAKIVAFTLNSIDQLRQLLVLDPKDKEKKLVEDMLHSIALLMELNTSEKINKTNGGSTIVKESRSIPKKNFLVYFEPFPDISINGTNPLYLIDELSSMGESVIRVDSGGLPDYALLEPEKCYLSWRIVLTTDEDVETIQDVFLFVQDSSKIQIVDLPEGNILQDVQKLENCFKLPLNEVVSSLTEREHRGPEKENQTPELSGAKRDELVSGIQLRAIRVNSSKIDEYMNLVSELIIAQSQLDLMSGRYKELEPVKDQFAKVIRQLRDNAFNMSLIPLNNMATRFKRLVHDLSEELNKEVELVTDGLETEVDKNIIEKLAEPLLHIIRNCIDHGIETAEERIEKGKNRAGVIRIKASYVGTFVEIEITDDGKGLDLEKIKLKAIQKSIISEDNELSDPELIALIFEPGFSTSDHLSDVSGRGVGMDIVRNRIKDLRGDVEVDTKKGSGTTFTIRLPLMLSIIDGLLTRVNDEMYVIPTTAIEKVYAFTSEQYKNKLRQVAVYEDREIPFLDLRKEFAPQSPDLKQQFLVAVKHQNNLFGLVVDDVVREYQAVVKPFGDMMNQHDMFLGASILGDGKVTLVIDVKKTIQKFSA